MIIIFLNNKNVTNIFFDIKLYLCHLNSQYWIYHSLKIKYDVYTFILIFLFVAKFNNNYYNYYVTMYYLIIMLILKMYNMPNFNIYIKNETN